MSIQRNGAGKWVIDFTCKGRRVTRVIGESKREAEAALAAMKADILREKYGLGRARQEVLFETHAKEYLELYAKQNKRSWARDEISIGHLNAFFRGKNLSDVTAELIEKYRLARRAAGRSPATINRELACLKTIFVKAIEWGKAETDPARKVKKFREPASRERILTADESRRLLEAASPEFRPLVVVALSSGMRRGEILALKWADLDLVRGIISITTSKSGKGRKIPMSGAVAAALGAVPHRGEYVFHNPETGTHVKGITRPFVTACARAKITGFRFHDLRHTFASRALELGADIMTVSKILGHSSIQMTAKYLHPTGESLRLAVERMSEFLEKGREKVETVEIRRPVSDLKSFN